MFENAFLLLTSKCNKNCTHCFYHQEEFIKRTDNINFDNVSKIIDGLKKLNVACVTITGGEPLIQYDLLVHLLRELKKIKIDAGLNTNGTLLTIEKIELLQKSGLKDIYLSSYYFNSIEQKIIEALKNSFNVEIIHVINKENISRSEGLLSRIKENGIKLIVQPAYVSKGYDKYKDLSPVNLDKRGVEKMFSLLEKYIDNADMSKLGYFRSIYLNSENKIHPKKCQMGVKSLVVYSDGDVYSCFHRPDLRCGNLFIDSQELIDEKLKNNIVKTSSAQCFGEHCASLIN